MKNKINFITGETYTLSELFSENRKIIIPDLQRDFCWGDEIHTDNKKELVRDFVKNLIDQFNNNKDFLNLGLIYGYEVPVNHIQLCDGQQRITTLYLLLGMLNKKTEDNLFRKYLISDYEYLRDNKETYLQYSIRESTLYFLSDLVCHFFVKEKDDKYFVTNIDDIQKSAWFFNEYKYDPSIQSIISALSRIDTILREQDENWCREFGLFVATRLTFIYYDLENRKNGEETYVVINTTGEPLSDTQNLKPLVFKARINDENKEMLNQWEEIETWFWQKRKTCNNNDTADAGFNEFLRWVTMLESDNEDEIKKILSEGKYTFPYDKLPFNEVYSYWKIIKFLFESWECHHKLDVNHLSPKENTKIENRKVINQIDCFILLPLFAYCKKWGIPDNDAKNRNLLRLYQFLQNLTRIENVAKNVNELVHDVIYIAEECEDIIKLIDFRDNVSKMILSDEEIKKLSILIDNLERRNEIEESFWMAQDQADIPCHNIWAGEILPLIEWSSKNGKFELEQFKKYVTIFDNTFKKDCGKEIDIVRRALLTRGLSNYPLKGNTNYSLGWEFEEWKVIINENKDAFKKFFDDLLNEDIQQKMKEMIVGFNDQENKWFQFVHKDYLLDYSEEKKVRDSNTEGFLLIKGNKATKYMSANNLHLKNYLSMSISVSGWEVYLYDGRDAHVVVVENKDKNLVFDIKFDKNQWNIDFFKRNCSADKVDKELKPYVDTKDWNLSDGRYKTSIDYIVGDDYSYPNIKNKIVDIINKIN